MLITDLIIYTIDFSFSRDSFRHRKHDLRVLQYENFVQKDLMKKTENIRELRNQNEGNEKCCCN